MTDPLAPDVASLSPTELVADLEAQLRPLELELAEAWWQSNTNSSPEADERRTAAELARREFLADPMRFAAVRAARDAVSSDDDPLLRRQLDVLHDGFVPHQVPSDLRRAIVELETRVESTFNNFRGEIDGQRVDDNAISEILRTSDDVDERRAAWSAAKQIGPEVADRIRELARLRNQAAQALGARDHFALALATSELDEDRLFATLDDVDRATAAPFAEWKHDVDERLATRFGCRVADLRPWHYDDPFFQAPPAEGAVEHRPPLLRRRPRGAHRPHLRRPRPRRALGARPQRPLRARRQEPARVLHRHRPLRRRARAVQRGAQRTLDGHDAPRVRPRDLRPRVRPQPAVARARRRARAHHRRHRDAHGPTAARPGVVARGGRGRRRPGRRHRGRPRRRAARRAPRVRALGAGDDQLRAQPLRRSRRRPRHAVVGPGRAPPAPAPARRPPRARLGRQDPPRGGARLLPELPLRGAVRVAARRHAPRACRRHRRSGGSRRAAPRRRLRAGRVAALGRARSSAPPASRSAPSTWPAS